MLFSVQYKEKKIINPRSLAVRQAYQERLIQFLGEGNQHNQSALIIHRRFVITRWLVSLIWCSVHSPFVLSARATTPKAWFAAISLSYGSRTIVLWFNQLQFLLSCKERKEVLHLFLFFRDSVTSHPNRRRDCPWSYLIRTPSLSIYKKLLFSDPELLSPLAKSLPSIPGAQRLELWPEGLGAFFDYQTNTRKGVRNAIEVTRSQIPWLTVIGQWTAGDWTKAGPPESSKHQALVSLSLL